jgi:3-oxoacyl-[acyl-carrier protein] reductase
MLASWQAAELLAAQPEGGVIINMSWDHVLTGMAGTTQQLFSAVKGGVLVVQQVAREDGCASRAREHPGAGWIETSFGASADEGWRQEIAESTPLKRWGVPDDVAGAAVFLASPAASFLTGCTLMVVAGSLCEDYPLGVGTWELELKGFWR